MGDRAEWPLRVRVLAGRLLGVLATLLGTLVLSYLMVELVMLGRVPSGRRIQVLTFASLAIVVAGFVGFTLASRTRRRADLQLVSRNALLTALINSSGDTIIFSLDRHYCYTAFNDRHREEMRRVWQADVHIGMCLLDAMHVAELRDLARQSMDRALQGEEFSEIQHQPDPSVYYERLWAPIRLDDEVVGVTAFIRDITTRKEAETDLLESEERFKSIFDHVTDGILLVDPDTMVFAMANRAMCAMLGYTGDTLTRLGVQDIHAAADLPAIDAAFRREGLRDSVVIHDLEVTRKDGTVFFADINCAPVTILGRRLVMMNVRNVTERRALQASLAQADRLASMGMLAAGVAHEINNPLSYVLYNLEYLAEELPKLPSVVEDKDDLVRSAKEALGGTQRIKDIVRGLSTFSRIDKGERARVDLGYVIECAASLAQNEIKYRARLIKKLDPVPAVWASEGSLCQVFLNLLINAAHAIGEAYPDRNSITVHTFAADGHVVAEVTDTGGGIPPENIERVFEPFFTTKKAGVGSGLGLAISRNIIHGFGGDISVESQPGAGARFIVRLPVLDNEPAERRHAEGDRAARIPAVRGRILVLDDEDAVRGVLRRILNPQHEVVTVASGLEGQTLLEKDRAFDLVLCDLMMPDMTGMELHEWLVTQDPALAGRVVFLTGGAFTPRAAEYLASVSNLRFEKPVDTAELMRVVMERILEYRQNRPAAGLETES